MATSRTLLAVTVLAAPLAICQAQTVFQIRDDAQGGDCVGQNIGAWDAATKTCRLNASLAGRLEIMDNHVKLDGAGLMLRSQTGETKPAITLDQRSMVEVRNIQLSGFSDGVLISKGESNRVENVAMSGASFAGRAIEVFKSTGNHIEGNHVTSTPGDGIVLEQSDRNTVASNRVQLVEGVSVLLEAADQNYVNDNTIRVAGPNVLGCLLLESSNDNQLVGNQISDCLEGIYMVRSSRNLALFNILTNSLRGGVFLTQSNDNRLFCNDFTGSQNAGADVFAGSVRNLFFWNNFLSSATASDRVPRRQNRFNMGKPTGGNYWQVHAPLCADGNGDGFCDATYVFANNEDELPRVDPIPWKINRELCGRSGGPAGSYGEPPAEDITLVVNTLRAVADALAGGHANWPELLAADVVLISATGRLEGRRLVSDQLAKALACNSPAITIEHSLLDSLPAHALIHMEMCGKHKQMLLVLGHSGEDNHILIQSIALSLLGH